MFLVCVYALAIVVSGSQAGYLKESPDHKGFYVGESAKDMLYSIEKTHYQGAKAGCTKLGMELATLDTNKILADVFKDLQKIRGINDEDVCSPLPLNQLYIGGRYDDGVGWHWPNGDKMRQDLVHLWYDGQIATGGLEFKTGRRCMTTASRRYPSENKCSGRLQLRQQRCDEMGNDYSYICQMNN